MSDYVCSECGKDGLYEVVEVTTEGSRDIDITERNGELAYSSGNTEVDHVMHGTEVHDGFGCSECGARFSTLREGARPAETRYECLDCQLWAYYRDPDPRCWDCGSTNLERITLELRQVAA